MLKAGETWEFPFAIQSSSEIGGSRLL